MAQKPLFDLTGRTPTLLECPPRSGVTRPLLQRYAAHLKSDGQAGQLSSGLWLVPHRLAADDVRRQLVAAGVNASLEPGIKTLSRLTDAIVSLDARSPSVVPDSATRWLVAQAIAELHRQRKLRVLAGVAARSGLVDAVVAMIAELKSRGLTADRFAAWARPRSRTQRDRELAAVVTTYQGLLDRAGEADRFDLPRLAAESLARRPEATEWQLVVVDGFASFAYYERQLLVELARRADEMFVSLPTLDAAGRDELVSAAHRTKQWLLDQWPDALRSDAGPADDKSIAASLTHLRTHLFLPPDRVAEPEPPAVASLEAVQIVAATDLYDEIVNVARRIKQLLTAGASPTDIVVVTPAMESHHRRLDEVFKVYGIPVSIATPATVGDAPPIRGLGSLLALQAEDWPFRRVLAVVSSGLFGLLDGELASGRWRTVRGAVEWLVRELQIATGQQELTKIVQRLAEAAPKTVADADSDPADARPSDRQMAARIAAEPLEQLLAACQSLHSSATPCQWVAACEQLATVVKLDLEPTQPSAWQPIREAAAWIERTAQATGLETPRWTLSEWLEQLNAWADRVPVAKSLNEEGRVRVYPASAARFLSTSHLFVIGMDEQAFSSASSGGGLYSEQRYDEMIAADASGRAVQATPPHERAMQLFHGVVASASESLTFSYSALDGSGQSTPPSPMLVEACRTFGERLEPALHATPRITPLPVADAKPCSLRDWRLLAIDKAMDKKPQLLTSFANSQLTKPTSTSLLDALTLMHHRVRGDSFGPMEGVLATPEVRQWFAERYGPEHQWSTSQLETYATCPYQFLMLKVLRLAPLGSVTLEVDYSRRGSLMHRVFSELHQRLDLLMGQMPVSQVPQTEFDEELAAAFRIAKNELATYGLEGALNEFMSQEVSKWARKYFEQHAEYDSRSQHFEQPMHPAHFELRFGKASREADDDESPDSTDEPYVLDLGDGMQVKFGGRIDRVDMGEVAGKRVFDVIDYKSASTHKISEEDMTSGRKLQPPLYALAAAELLSSPDHQALPLRAGYWVLRDKGFTDKNTQELYHVEAGQVVPTKDWLQLEGQVKQRVRELVEGVRAAEFPMYNDDEHCTSSCDLGHICRVAQTRSLGKTWPPMPESEGEAADA